MSRSSFPLVGRTAELATLVDAVRGSGRGTAAAVVVGGDAGIGKTRLLSELVSVATGDGVLCLMGHCVDLGDTPPPYLPFTEAFTRLSAERPDVVTALLDEFPALVRLLPRRVGAEAAVPADRVERGELFDSVRGALVALATEQPVTLLVEDVHWADQATRDLLGFLFTRLDSERVVVVATYRADDLHRRHPLRRTLAEWARLPSVTRINLDRLAADDIGALVRSIDPDPIAESDVRSIVRRADGNAFFAVELLAATLQNTDAQQLPWQLADLLLVRLDRMSEDAREVVRVAAVAGRRVSHEMLEAVVEMDDRELNDALHEAIDRYVLELTSSGRGYVFRHALLAEAVYDDLLPGEKLRLHARYAAVLAADESKGRPAELARHALASHDLDTAFRASIDAGNEAMSLAAPQEALAHFESALELAPRVAELTVPVPQLTLLAVEAADAAGHTLRGIKLAKRALADLAPDASPIARATLLYAKVKAALGGEIDEEILTIILDALRLVPEDPPTPLRAQVLALYARVAINMGREVEAVRAATDALEVGEESGCLAAATDARTTLAMAERRTGDPDAAAHSLEAVVEQACEANDFGSEMRSRFSLASLWHEQCELQRAQEAFAYADRRATEAGRRWENFAMSSRAMTATIQYLRGDWDGALHTLDLTGERPTMVGGAVMRATAMLVRAGRGDVHLVDELPDLRPYWQREGRIAINAVHAGIEVCEQLADVDAAFALMDDLIETISRLWLDPWFLGRIQLSAAGIAVLCAAAVQAPAARHPGLAAEGARLLADGRTSFEKGLPRGRALGREGRAWVNRLEAESARLRWLTGQDPPAADEFVRLWQQTVDEFDYGNAVQLARSRARLAGALRATGRAAEAAEVAEQALTVAEAMGATPLIAELRAHAGRRGGDEPSGLRALTEREREVLAELVDGRTNRQIAAKLYISEKTVSVHVSNILGKFGVRSRAEAAAFARRDPAFG